jgi:CRISPR/Cas system-associated exonuclease Cas4 (RecB family)
VPHSETYVDGIWFPSATTIINAKPKPWLDAWRQKWGVLAERKTRIANIIGTEFHRCVEQWLDTGGYRLNEALSATYYPRLRGMMGSFIDWASNVDGIVSQTELKVLSKMYTYSGTLDAVGILDGRPMLYDWKSSSRIYDDMEMQLAAYAQAYNEQTGAKVRDGLIVCVSKDKPDFKVTTRQFRLGKRAFNKFLKLREMFDDMKARPIDAEDSVPEETGC